MKIKYVMAAVAMLISSAAIADDQLPEDNPAVPGPIDYGDVVAPTGPQNGKRPFKTGMGGPNKQAVVFDLTAPASSIPVGNENAHTTGVFGPALSWPIVAIHVILLPDGRVMSWGIAAGANGQLMTYDVWDPVSGTHLTLPNKTNDDIFCSGQTILPWDGEALIVGGNKFISGVTNNSNSNTDAFRPVTNTLRAVQPMAFARWYATVLTLASGKQVALGGRQAPNVPTITPERFTLNVGWETLTGATSDPAFGSGGGNWSYPRAWVAPSGHVFILSNTGTMFDMNPSAGASGTISQLPTTTVWSSNTYPAAMFAPGKVLSLRLPNSSYVIDINGPTPVITRSADIDQVRYWSTMTTLPDGRVLISGGSTVVNQLTGVAYTVQMWDPATGVWTTGATYTKPRLYHSEALLLPDATVLVAGGGNPGPVTNLNAEVYYPGYLYSSDGTPAVRPTITSAPTQVSVSAGSFGIGVSGSISKVALVHTGAMTHSFDGAQRAIQVPFVQNGSNVTVSFPTKNLNVLLPGYWMLFVFDAAGVPSIADIIRLTG
jgi:galactose oxidase-like protein